MLKQANKLLIFTWFIQFFNHQNLFCLHPQYVLLLTDDDDDDNSQTFYHHIFNV